jgi:hypothetical protein
MDFAADASGGQVTTASSYDDRHEPQNIIDG